MTYKQAGRGYVLAPMLGIVAASIVLFSRQVGWISQVGQIFTSLAALWCLAGHYRRRLMYPAIVIYLIIMLLHLPLVYMRMSDYTGFVITFVSLFVFGGGLGLLATTGDPYGGMEREKWYTAKDSNSEPDVPSILFYNVIMAPILYVAVGAILVILLAAPAIFVGLVIHYGLMLLRSQ